MDSIIRPGHIRPGHIRPGHIRLLEFEIDIVLVV